MTDLYPPSVQKPALHAFRTALGAQWKLLCRDDCGDWQIKGKFGHIYAVPGIPWDGLEKTEGFQIYLKENSIRAWGFAKKELKFCRVTQDGDDEGMLFLDRLPTEKQAQAIRGRLGIKKRKELSEERLAKLNADGRSTRLQPRTPRSETTG